MIGKKKAALILSMLMASSVFSAASAAEPAIAATTAAPDTSAASSETVTGPVWLEDYGPDPLVYKGEHPVVTFDGVDKDGANGVINVSWTNTGITTENGATLTLRLDPAENADTNSYTGIYAENTNDVNAYGDPPLENIASYSNTISAPLDIQVTNTTAFPDFLAAESGATVYAFGLSGEKSTHVDQTLVLEKDVNITLLNRLEPKVVDLMKSDGTGYNLLSLDNTGVALQVKGDTTVNGTSETDHGSMSGMQLRSRNGGAATADFGKNVTFNTRTKKEAARGIEVDVAENSSGSTTVGGNLSITARSEAGSAYGISQRIGPEIRLASEDGTPVDSSHTTFTVQGDTLVDVSADKPIEGPVPEGGTDSSNPKGVLSEAANGAVTDTTFQGKLTVRAQGPKLAEGIHALAYSGTVNITANGQVDVLARGSEAITDDSTIGLWTLARGTGKSTVQLNKGADIVATNRAVSVTSRKNGEAVSAPGDPAVATATIQGGPVHLVSLKAPEADGTQDIMSGAIYVMGANATANVNMDGGHPVTVSGDVKSAFHGLVNLKLDTEDSSLDSNLLAYSGSTQNVTVEKGTFMGSTYDGSALNDPEKAATVNLTLKDAIWNVRSSSMNRNLAAERSVVNLASATGGGNGDEYQTLRVVNLTGDRNGFLMDMDPTKNKENSDQILVSGDFTGEHIIGLRLTEDGDVSPAQGTVLAKVKNNSGTFKVRDQEAPLVWKHFELGTKAAENDEATPDLYSTDWYLKTARLEDPVVRPTTIVSTLQTAHAMTYGTWREEAGNSMLQQRLGNLHAMEGTDDGIWFRTEHGKDRNSGVFSYDNTTHRYQLGYDHPAEVDGGRRYSGLAVSWSKGDGSYAYGSGELKGAGLSLYTTTVKEDGSYLDTILDVGRYKTDLQGRTSEGDIFTGSTKAGTISLSSEYGKKIAMDRGLYFEPQAQMVLGMMQGNDYTTSNSITVDNKRMFSAIGRIGFNVGQDLPGDGKGRIYAKVNVLHEFAGSYDNTFSLAGQSVKAESDYRGTWLRYGVGMNWNPSTASQLHLDLERTSGGDFTRKWQWNAGMNWRF